ncbi:uncharacterized protein LOC129693704 [Leucoraja erinacea]|uniref:uncharacterized protein LOC129693704 n=1 Tax=Leucoraja erinaceus TaxID=7782 RepID=UPI0024559A1A|nr:uncharacterized protein LOC129693704 [Leucoraja erinacea]
MSLSLLVWLYVSLIASVDADWSQAPHNSFKERVPRTGNGFSQDSRTLGDIIFDVYANNASMPSLLERMLAESGVKPGGGGGGGQHKVGFQPSPSQPTVSRLNLTQHTRKGRPRLPGQSWSGRPDTAKPAGREDLGYAEKELQLFHQMFEEYLHFKAHRKGEGVAATRRGLEETCEKILGRKHKPVEADSTVVIVDDGYQGKNATKPPLVASKEEEAFSSFETLVKAMLSPFSQLPTTSPGNANTNTRFPDDVTVTREEEGNSTPVLEITQTAGSGTGTGPPTST